MKIQTKTGAVVATGQLKRIDPVNYRRVGNNDTPLATFGVMVSRKRNPDGSQSAEWLNCKAWRGLANRIALCPGGSEVLIAGHMENESWNGRDGMQHSREICVCEFIALANGDSPVSDDTEPRETPLPADVFHDEPDDGGELPF
jgi:single-stranded DNA-binding protein